jgi:N-acetylmuramoyl-L-alanine amidase
VVAEVASAGKPEPAAQAPIGRPASIVQRVEVDASAAEGVEGSDPVLAPASVPSVAAAPPHREALPEVHEAPHPQGNPDRDHLVALAHAVKGAGDVPLSAQMGLKVKRVVIDAGHGGRDTGAMGPDGAKEKDVTLAVAKRLADKLRGAGLDVVLTRQTDVSVPLEKRAEIANDAHADLFISVHCNASTAPSLHGVETYSLNVSSDRYSMRLAARENATSERSISDMRMMLADLTTRADTNDSERLAHEVQKSVVNGLRTRYDAVRDLGTKEALFYVLLGAKMPAILVETSFISNPTEEKRLTDPQFQDELATSIAAGVDRFVTDRIALASLPTAELP